MSTHVQRMQRAIEVAAAYRREITLVGGYAILWRMRGITFETSLERPHVHRPGRLAIDVDGRVWVATGQLPHEGGSKEWSNVWDPTPAMPPGWRDGVMAHQFDGEFSTWLVGTAVHVLPVLTGGAYMVKRKEPINQLNCCNEAAVPPECVEILPK